MPSYAVSSILSQEKIVPGIGLWVRLLDTSLVVLCPSHLRLTAPVPCYQLTLVCVHLLAIKGLLRLTAITVITIFTITNPALLCKECWLFHYKENAKWSVSEYGLIGLWEWIRGGSRLYAADKFICNPLKYPTMWLPEINQPALKYISTTRTEWC